ncbi:Solute carrier family 40 protein [Mycena sanguinolenta]|uniref:Solute carrier family 40 member n=1 Tax=Mycena sanguinolenta TaxID=230812 RepID=A0A8H6Z9U5_9AGAR|nr:Solute carrier family 40 protein [Mycena sanguinolenta]
MAVSADRKPTTPPARASGGSDAHQQQPHPTASITTRIPAPLTRRLYTSHFLSTWNSRLFEFGAVLFLASIFPDTLLPMSVYALARSAAAILLAQPVGGWIDTGNRLSVVRMSVVGQRLAVAGSCAVFWILQAEKDSRGGTGGKGRERMGLFGLSVALACVEKVCSVMNLVSVERDWVVVITQHNEQARRELNAGMRRIDLLCKLLGPLAISTIAIASTMIAIWVTLAMNLVAVPLEYICIAQVYKLVPALQREQPRSASTNIDTDDEAHPTSRVRASASRLRTAFSRVLPISSLPFYLNHPAFLPSFSLSLLYLTVLSFSGQMITYLISVGYTLSLRRPCPHHQHHIRAQRYLDRAAHDEASRYHPQRHLESELADDLAGCGRELVFRGLSWAGDEFAAICDGTGGGCWNIVQDEVQGEYRGTFSTVESSFQNLFDLLSYATTIVFSRPDQFQWPVVISVAAVYVAGGLYAFFVRKRRGHLFHAPQCICLKHEVGEGGGA